MYTKTNLSCIICLSPSINIDNEVRGGETYRIQKCVKCGTVFCPDHYSATSPDYVNLKELSQDHIDMSRFHKEKAYNQFLKKVSNMDKDVLVDIGCGTGGFMEYASSVWGVVQGFDASVAQVEYCLSRGFDCVEATSVIDFFAQKPRVGGRKYWFTLWDVLEHIREPEVFMSELSKVMFSGDILFVSIPTSSITVKKRFHRLLGRSFSYDPHEHVFYYNEKSIKLFLEYYGFKVSSVYAVVPYSRSFSFFNLLRLIGYRMASIFSLNLPQIGVIAKKI